MAGQAPRSETVGGLARGVVSGAEELVRLEIALARQELKEAAIRNLGAVGLLTAGGLLALIGVLVALPLALVIASGRGAAGVLVWFAVDAVAAAGLGLAGWSRLRLRVPDRTIQSLKETREWIHHQISSPNGS